MGSAPVVPEVVAVTSPPLRGSPRPLSEGGVLANQVSGYRLGRLCEVVWCEAVPCTSEEVREVLALTLLVTRVVTNDHHPTVPADDLALVADGLDARVDLHRCFLLGYL